MRGLEHLLPGLVLAAEQDPVLELLREAVKVLGAVCLSARNVKNDNGLLVVGKAHVRDLALHDDRVVLANEVSREPRLPVVACGVGNPHNVPIVSGLLKPIQNALLPGARDKVLIPGALVEHALELPESPGILDKSLRKLLGHALNPTNLKRFARVAEVVAGTATATAELAARPWALHAGVVLRNVGAALLGRAVRGVDVRLHAALVLVPASETDDGDLLGHLHVRLDVEVAVLLAALELPCGVALIGVRGEDGLGGVKRGLVEAVEGDHEAGELGGRHCGCWGLSR